MAKTEFLSWSQTAGDNTDIDGIGILGSNNVNNFDNPLRTLMAQAKSGIDGKLVYAAKAGNYTAVANDNNATHRYTASATVTLTAAATLGLSWHYTIVADGGNVTIDPDGAETINGATTYLVAKGTSATIICDGTAFYVAIKPHVWETINYFSLAAAANFSQTGLSAFLMLKLTGQISNSINSSFGIRTSTNNGSSYDSGATDYGYQLLGGTGATASAASTNTSVGVVTATSASAIIFETIITNFGLTGECYMTSRVGGNTGAALLSEINFTKRSNNTARNAFLFFPAVGGNMTGFVTLEGIRA
ncbi:hypothetical protein ELG66_01575 [Rhizobium leguminosarum]|uniref:hypothetical protein n=1 Tax=Rhizobium leguminosarum TaxID=384 RepID=UPI001031B526|nr:hypothetical protein [Rhizobium leguminosarum]TBH34699.1 hypothetical protein ELG66_01575 [Rhizobium leguminosarum]